MYISSLAAKNMASIVLLETQGSETLAKQLPLSVVDQNDRWLVFGTPYKASDLGLDYCQFYIIFEKNSAEIVGLGSEASLIINPLVKKDIIDAVSGMTEERLLSAFGPRKIEQMDGANLQRNLEFNEMLYGGLINTNEGAIDYAAQLIRSLQDTKFDEAPILIAEERSGVWYVSTRQPARDGIAEPILSFDRLTGHVISCAV